MWWFCQADSGGFDLGFRVGNVVCQSGVRSVCVFSFCLWGS